MGEEDWFYDNEGNTWKAIDINEVRSIISCSCVAALSGSYAIRVFYPCQDFVNGGVWHLCLSVLFGKEGRANLGVRYVGFAVPAVCKGGAGENGVECHRCHRSHWADCYVLLGMEQK